MASAPLWTAWRLVFRAVAGYLKVRASTTPLAAMATRAYTRLRAVPLMRRGGPTQFRRQLASHNPDQSNRGPRCTTKCSQHVGCPTNGRAPRRTPRPCDSPTALPLRVCVLRLAGRARRPQHIVRDCGRMTLLMFSALLPVARGSPAWGSCASCDTCEGGVYTPPGFGLGGEVSQNCPNVADGVPVHAQCASLPVPLDYSVDAGANISYFAKKLLASQPSRGEIWLLEGGPGFSGVQLECFIAPLRRLTGYAYDIVIPDHRGTGRSSPLVPLLRAPPFCENDVCYAEKVLSLVNHTRHFTVSNALASHPRTMAVSAIVLSAA
jgi:hypothetical protein